jgi:hypothetical protein
MDGNVQVVLDNEQSPSMDEWMNEWKTFPKQGGPGQGGTSHGKMDDNVHVMFYNG